MNQRWGGYLIAAGVFFLDRLTKWLIVKYVSPWETHIVIPHVFNIVHTQNAGAAFGVLANSESEWRTFFLIGLSALALILVSVLLWQAGQTRNSSGLLRVALGLILGGALGNVFDRVAYGTVTDFFQVFLGSYEWPSFNVADSAITIGACLLLIDLWRSSRRRVESAEERKA